ncbi:hypothetical protein OUZ56_003548 [Daphnia magna]|uniref:Uncharacterized protein n=1 Tax=Daphnia magna TaxID=35525 RepID=A0ABR0A954_9CRUS|nr:hypothetical protein OUZ56_003548 [Daphnia magna]
MAVRGSSLWQALAAQIIRSTPVSDKLLLPAVLLQGHNLRGARPFLPATLQPRFISASTVKSQLQLRQATTCFTKDHPPDIPGTVSGACENPQLYIIKTKD